MQDGKIAAHAPVSDALTSERIAAVVDIDARWVEIAGERLLSPFGRAR